MTISNAFCRIGVPDVHGMLIESRTAWESFEARRESCDERAACLGDYNDLTRLKEYHGRREFRDSVEALMADIAFTPQAAAPGSTVTQVAEELRALLSKVEARFYYWPRREFGQAAELLDSALTLHASAGPDPSLLRQLLFNTRHLHPKAAERLRQAASWFRSAGESLPGEPQSPPT